MFVNPSVVIEFSNWQPNKEYWSILLSIEMNREYLEIVKEWTVPETNM